MIVDEQDSVYLLLPDLDLSITDIDEIIAAINKQISHYENKMDEKDKAEHQKSIEKLERIREDLRANPHKIQEHLKAAKRAQERGKKDEEFAEWVAKYIVPIHEFLDKEKLFSIYTFLSKNPNIKDKAPTYTKKHEPYVLYTRVKDLEEAYKKDDNTAAQDALRKCLEIFANDNNSKDKHYKNKYDDYLKRKVTKEIMNQLDKAANFLPTKEITDEQFRHIIALYAKTGYTQSGFDFQSMENMAKLYCEQQKYILLPPPPPPPPGSGKSNGAGGTNNGQDTKTQTSHSESKYSNRNRIGVIGILFGSFGVHNFCLGRNKLGAAQFLCSIFCAVIGNFAVSNGISLGYLLAFGLCWGYAEGVAILAGKKWKNIANADKRGFFRFLPWYIKAIAIHVGCMFIVAIVLLFGGLL